MQENPYHSRWEVEVKRIAKSLGHCPLFFPLDLADGMPYTDSMDIDKARQSLQEARLWSEGKCYDSSTQQEEASVVLIVPLGLAIREGGSGR